MIQDGVFALELALEEKVSVLEEGVLTLEEAPPLVEKGVIALEGGVSALEKEVSPLETEFLTLEEGVCGGVVDVVITNSSHRLFRYPIFTPAL